MLAHIIPKQQHKQQESQQVVSTCSIDSLLEVEVAWCACMLVACPAAQPVLIKVLLLLGCGM